MARNRTPKQHEKHLNELLFDAMTEQEAVENYQYLASKNRSPRTTIANIKKCYYERALGSLIRRLDPICFNASITD